MFQDWGITVDTITQSYALQLNAFDGKPLPPLYLTANPPNMLPTVILTGVNVSPGRASLHPPARSLTRSIAFDSNSQATGQASKRSLDEGLEKLQKRSGAVSDRGINGVHAIVGLAGAGVLVMTGLLGL